MSYADVLYYKTEYGGTVIPDEAIAGQLSKASDQVDALTYNRIRGRGFANLSAFQQALIKKATCAQADFNEQYSDFVDMPLQGFSAGSVSMSFAAERINGVSTSRVVKGYLDQTGLTSRRL